MNGQPVSMCIVPGFVRFVLALPVDETEAPFLYNTTMLL